MAWDASGYTIGEIKKKNLFGVIIHRNVRFFGGILEKNSNVVPPGIIDRDVKSYH